jgi:hypothetical protein
MTQADAMRIETITVAHTMAPMTTISSNDVGSARVVVKVVKVVAVLYTRSIVASAEWAWMPRVMTDSVAAASMVFDIASLRPGHDVVGDALGI